MIRFRTTSTTCALLAVIFAVARCGGEDDGGSRTSPDGGGTGGSAGAGANGHDGAAASGGSGGGFGGLGSTDAGDCIQDGYVNLECGKDPPPGKLKCTEQMPGVCAPNESCCLAKERCYDPVAEPDYCT